MKISRAGSCLSITFFLVLAVANYSPRAFAVEEAAVPIEIATAVSRSVVEPLWVPGTVVSRQDSNVASEIAGRLDWLAEVGDRVEAGDPIARFDEGAWRIQLRIDTADIRRLDANIEFLNLQLDRFMTLADSNSTAASEVDRLKMELRMLNQQHAAAIARRDQTRRELDLTKLSAPFAGVIVERSGEVGEFARVGEPILRMVNVSSLEVVARAPVNVGRNMRSGDVVALKSDTVTLRTPVRALIPIGDERSRGIELRVELPAGDWIVGDAVRVALDDGERAAHVTIPRDALVLRDGLVYVFRLLADATAQRVPVRVGNGIGDLVAVDGDVGIGDQVVVRGAERLKDGQAVRVLGDSTVAGTIRSVNESG
ncbi:MAG: efflux RND transporter periplasmic adaptor subunit [Gammaproteobacteria bacterium]